MSASVETDAERREFHMYEQLSAIAAERDRLQAHNRELAEALTEACETLDNADYVMTAARLRLAITGAKP